MTEINTENILNTFSCVREARQFINDHKPLIDVILSHRGKEERLTVRAIGEEILGKEKYHSKGTLWNGEQAFWRDREAAYMTGMLTQIFRKLCYYGVVERHEVRDYDHPIEVEYEGYCYLDADGKPLPEEVEVALADGRKVKIPAGNLPGVTGGYAKTTRTVYPKIGYYTFM